MYQVDFKNYRKKINVKKIEFNVPKLYFKGPNI